MPTKKKKQKPEGELVTVRSSHRDALVQAAKDSGLSNVQAEMYVDGIKDFSDTMHDEIDARGLTPPQALSASLQMLASTINCFPKTTHEQLCSDIYTQLRSFCDLKTQ